MKKTFSVFMTFLLIFGLAIGVSAAVTFDAATGNGYVGKGDVQSALGLNNAQLQNVAENLVFTYKSVDAYEVTVEWTTGEGTKGEQTHIVNHEKTSTVSGNVDYGTKKVVQVSGFNLTGISGSTTVGSIPAEGEVYPGNSGHIVTSVTLVGSTGGLYVNGIALQ